MNIRPNALSLSPNTALSDGFRALGLIFNPIIWLGEGKIKKLEQKFREMFKTENVKSFNSGRSALFALLKSFGIGKNDEVVVQAFTCVAVPDAVIWTGAKPVFADIDKSLNIDPGSLEKLISEKTKAVIVQHTFGVPAEMYSIKKIVQKHNLVLIEDCAHSLGNSYENKLLGTFGDGAIFSFGRDKMISSVFGGMAIINSGRNNSILNLDRIYGSVKKPSFFFVLQQLLHPVLFSFLILPFYNVQIGKLLLWLFLKLKILGKPVQKIELRGGKPAFFPGRFHNCLAALSLLQIERLENFRKKRMENTGKYIKRLKSLKGRIEFQDLRNEKALLRFSILTGKSGLILSEAKKKGMLLGNWYRNIIDPAGTDFTKIGYKKGTCPNAEYTASRIVNLPTYPYISGTEVDRVSDIVIKSL